MLCIPLYKLARKGSNRFVCYIQLQLYSSCILYCILHWFQCVQCAKRALDASDLARHWLGFALGFYASRHNQSLRWWWTRTSPRQVTESECAGLRFSWRRLIPLVSFGFIHEFGGDLVSLLGWAFPSWKMQTKQAWRSGILNQSVWSRDPQVLKLRWFALAEMVHNRWPLDAACILMHCVGHS